MVQFVFHKRFVCDTFCSTHSVAVKENPSLNLSTDCSYDQGFTAAPVSKFVL